MKCKVCATEMDEQANFCPACGEKTDYYYQQSEFTLEREFELFISANSDYYLDKWEDAKKPSRYAGWSWVAFFFGFMWLGFRKMYLQQFIFFLVALLFSYSINASIGFLMSIYLGIRGNSMYYNHVTKKVTKITNHVNKTVIDMRLEREGGYSLWKAVLIPVGLCIVIGILDS